MAEWLRRQPAGLGLGGESDNLILVIHKNGRVVKARARPRRAWGSVENLIIFKVTQSTESAFARPGLSGESVANQTRESDNFILVKGTLNTKARKRIR